MQVLESQVPGTTHGTRRPRGVGPSPDGGNDLIRFAQATMCYSDHSTSMSDHRILCVDLGSKQRSARKTTWFLEEMKTSQ